MSTQTDQSRELDSATLLDMKFPPKLRETRKAQGIHTAGDIRKALSRNPEFSKLLPKANLRAVQFRLANKDIFCRHCGKAMYLYRSTMACGDGCGGIIPIGTKQEYHRSFPDRMIVSALDRKYG